MAWFDSPGGTTCVVAYDAIGAVSLADSYVNEANPGTYDAAPGTAPTWAYGTGWTFNGSTQYLTTGVVPDMPAQTWSMILRFSGATGSTGNYAAATNKAGSFFALVIRPGATRVFYGNSAALAQENVSRTSGVLAVAGTKYYADGSNIGTFGAAGASTTGGVFIGAENGSGSPGSYYNGSIQALAIYSGTLSASDVATITTAMLALPTPAGQPTALRRNAQGRRLFGPRIGAGGW